MPASKETKNIKRDIAPSISNGKIIIDAFIKFIINTFFHNFFP